ncbi:uncharacterized protein si:dkey-250k15.4 isoform X1 [Entelurus aequoreus]|uniref:uncharacterized protein si:dkey-250k15.4 isoform X1 n=1 Tax=Entelurus aequoreus TaxID=161455 RepID=UPI002B1D1EEB|nr:uncharacterized protein si:dkey-250k15.4 isoform X1 [Entelurus aequoreus]XP_061919889.1 uncharacterized protein si:dkey-250k15.4 isoform X1 [Entelurus aequoreus]
MSHMDGKCKCDTDAKHKMKRLKSRKERSQMRGVGKEAKPHQHHCHHPSSQDVAHLNNCRHSQCCAPRRECSEVPPPTQEPSIITTARLIGHHGLFNHEVKSIDIERLLLEQQNKVPGEAEAHKKKKKAASTSHNAENDPFEKGDACEKKILQCCNSQASDITPGQQQQRHSSASGESSKAHKNSGETNLPFQEPMEKTPPQIVSSEEHTPKNQGPLDCQPPVLIISPSAHWPHSSVTVETGTDAQREDLVSKSVSSLGQRLCATLRFPFMRRRDLVTESKEVLLHALQEAHGPHLQQNLLHMRTHCCPHFEKQSLTQKVARKDEHRLWSPDGFPAPFQITSVVQSCFGTKGATALETPERKHFPWELSPQPTAAGWPASPMETSAGFLENIFRPSLSPDFRMDFGSSTASSSHHLFATSPAWRVKSSAPRHLHFDRPGSEMSAAFNPFQDSFRDERRSHRSCHDPTGRYSLEQFPLERDLPVLESEKYYFAPTFSAQSHLPLFSQFSQPPTLTSLHSRHSDRIHYPPSYTLEKDPTVSLTPLPSPDRWCFPPMRLY